MVAGKLQKQSAEYGHSGQHGRALGLYLKEKEGLVMDSNQQNMLKSYLRKTKTPPITDKKRYCMFEEKKEIVYLVTEELPLTKYVAP